MIAELELWTMADIADYLGIQRSSVYRQLHRWGIEPVMRRPGRGGVNLYRADEIRAAHQQRPGRGNWGRVRDEGDED